MQVQKQVRLQLLTTKPCEGKLEQKAPMMPKRFLFVTNATEEDLVNSEKAVAPEREVKRTILTVVALFCIL